MNEVVTYIPPFIRSVTRSQSALFNCLYIHTKYVYLITQKHKWTRKIATDVKKKITLQNRWERWERGYDKGRMFIALL